MKKIFVALFALTILITPVFAQQELTNTEIEIEETQATTSTDQYFVLELKKGTQNPITKKIPFTIYITPNINSSKTQILWDVPSVFNIEKKHKEFVSLTKGQTYSFSASLTPNKSGLYEVSVNVISWQTDSNKSNSANYNIAIDKSLTVQPVDTMYYIYILLFILGIIGVSILLFLLIKKGATILAKKAKTWLTPPY